MHWCFSFGCRAKIEEVMTKTLPHSPTTKTCFFRILDFKAERK